jgi:hypothetical protein
MKKIKEEIYMNRYVKIAFPAIVIGLLFAMQVSAVSVSWKSNGNNFWETDQSMWIEKLAPYTFWASQWSWTGTGLPAYMGLQTNGALKGQAIFSAWNATGASGYNCGKFSGEGEGYHCLIPFNISTNTIYFYRVWRLNKDSVGQWWGAWIDSTFIGEIRVNSSDTGMNVPVDWTEYFGGGKTCDTSPKSVVDWAMPAFDYYGNGLGKYGYYSQLNGVDISCNNGVIIPRNIVLTPYGT